MRYKLSGVYRDYISIYSEDDNELFSGSVFEIVEIKNEITYLNLGDIYVLYFIDSDITIGIKKNSYVLIKNENLVELCNKTYENFKRLKIQELTIDNFLKVYFKNSDKVEVYSLDDLNIETLRGLNFKVEMSSKSYKEIYFIKDDFELILNYELERRIILLDSSKIELIQEEVSFLG